MRSGSKVGSKYKGQIASTNDAYCPTLKAAVKTELPLDVEAVMEIVIDGLSEADVSKLQPGQSMRLVFDTLPADDEGREVAHGQIVRKEDLMVKVWGTNETSDESISRTVYRLRVAMQSSGGPAFAGPPFFASFQCD